jgi:hypothetical protein
MTSLVIPCNCLTAALTIANWFVKFTSRFAEDSEIGA